MEYNNLHIIKNSLIEHKMSILRDESTHSKEFRQLIKEITLLIAYQACENLELEDVVIKTPLQNTSAKRLKDKIYIVPILRAGLGMLDAIQSIIPNAKVGVLGMYRNEQTLETVEYYSHIEDDLSDYQILIIDPMLATANTAVASMDMLKSKGAKKIKLLSIVSAPIGVESLLKAHSDCEIYTASLDEKLNDKGYILPGLGDAGDRIFFS